jgi:RNA polymerase-binding protein DksA
MAKQKTAAKKKTRTPSRSKSTKPVKGRVLETGPAAPRAQTARKGYGKADLEYFKNLILEKRKEILEDLESLKASMMDVTTGEYVSENSTYSLHMEQGTDTMEREKTFMYAAREGKFLNHLDDALKRIEKGVYGFCTECGKLIEKERLEAVPHAQMCVDCKLKKGSKQQVG